MYANGGPQSLFIQQVFFLNIMCLDTVPAPLVSESSADLHRPNDVVDMGHWYALNAGNTHV